MVNARLCLFYHKLKKNIYLVFVAEERVLEKGKQPESFALQGFGCAPLVSAHSLLL